MALTTTNQVGDYNFASIAKVFQDTARATPITAADGTQLVLGATDDSAAGRHMTFNAGVPYVSLGGANALAFGGTQRSDLPAGTTFSGADIEFIHDFLIFFPTITMTGSQTLYSQGDNSASSRFSVAYQPPASGATTGNIDILMRSNAGGTPLQALVVNGWKFDTLQAITIRKKIGGAVEVFIDGVKATVTQNTPFPAGVCTFGYATLGALRASTATAGASFFTGRILRMRSTSSAASATAKPDAEVLADHQELYATRPSVVLQPALLRPLGPYRRGLSWSNPVMTLDGSVQNVTGTPATLWAQVVRVSDGGTVKAMANAGAIFSGSDFSGGQITAIPAGGPYLIQYEVRNSANAVLAAITGNNTFYVGDVVLIPASSSTLERAGYEDAGTPSTPTAAFLASQTDSWRFDVNIGRGHREMAAALFAVTGRPTIIKNMGVGGTTLQAWTQDGSTLFATMSAKLAQLGFDCDYIAYGAGANDSFKPFNGDFTIESAKSHAAKLNRLHAKVLTLIGKTDVKTIIAGMNNRLFDTDQPIGSDGSARATMGRGGEVLFARSLPRGWYISSMDAAVVNNDIHPTEGGQALIGSRMGTAFATAVAGKVFHPRVTVATLLADGAEIAIEHSTGTDFSPQPAAGYSGFRVYDDLGALVADSENAATVVTKVSATKVKVPFTVDPARAYIVAHQNGTWTKPQGNILKDNNGLSVAPTIMGVGDAMVGGQRFAVTNV